MRKSLKEVLMDRDNLTNVEANSQITYVQFLMEEYIREGDYESVENICMNELGLVAIESDYIEDLI